MASVTLPESLVEKLKKLKEVREDQDTVVKKINKFHSRLGETTREKAEKYSDKLWQKLKEYYVNAKRLAETEERLCAQCVAELEALGQSSAGVPPSASRKRAQGLSDNKKSKAKQHHEHAQGAAAPGSAAVAGGHARPGSGSQRKAAETRGVLAALGEMVAARISPRNAEKDDWILVKVLGHDADANMYEVFDEEPGDEDEPGPKKYKLDASCIIPLPKTEAPQGAPDFPAGCHVLAVYPGTTSLYRATVVVGSQIRKSKEDDYFLEFDDDEEEGFEGLPQRQVPFYHVVALPSGHRQ